MLNPLLMADGRQDAHAFRTAALASVALAVVLLGAPSPASAFRARISRPIVQESLAPGQAANGTIEIENESDTPASLDVYLQDWEYLEGGTGDKLFSAPGSSPWSASSWIAFYPQRLELAPRAKGLVHYTVTMPASDVFGGHYAVLFFESTVGVTAPNEAGVSVQYTGRLGSLFEIEVAGTVERTGELASFTVGRPDEDRPLALAYAFRNTGNVAIRPKAYFNIVDDTGRYFGRGEFSQLYTFPGRSGATATEWTGGLAPGDYTVILTVDIGGGPALVREERLSVRRGVEVLDVRLRGGDPSSAQLRLHNSGHVQTEVAGTLAVETAAGGPVVEWAIPTTLLAPDERRDVVVGGSGVLALGAYQCRVRLSDAGGTTERLLPCQLAP